MHIYNLGSKPDQNRKVKVNNYLLVLNKMRDWVLELCSNSFQKLHFHDKVGC